MSSPVRIAHYPNGRDAEVRLDQHGMEWVVSGDGDPMYVTPCCNASAKGGECGTVCRACYREIDPSLGGIVEPLPEDDRPEWRASRDRYNEWVAANMDRWLGRTSNA